MEALLTAGFEDRLYQLHEALNSTQEGRAAMKSLAPSTMILTDRNIVDFCDWTEFHQWPQST
jgi:hypothetical protein